MAASALERTAAAALAACAAAALAGCVSYPAPKPLPTGADIQANPSALKVDTTTLRLQPLKPVVVDAKDGLDPMEVAVLAVLNSPDLAAKRAALGVNAAQVFSTGLLPDPQIAVGADHPFAGPDNQNAFSISPSLDLTALITRSAVRNAARFTARQADLDVLWAEWGVAQQARALAQTALSGEARAIYLQQVLTAAADRYARSSQALANRDVTLQTTAADLAVKVDAQTQLATAQHDAAKARRDLNALLNLDAAVRLPLVDGGDTGAYDEGQIRQSLAGLADRRPDLLALRAGYSAQDQNIRRAALARFPLTQIAAAFARDTAGVVTGGVSAAFALPIFNGGKGEERIQLATREQLHAEYQARLDLTAAEVADAAAELRTARAAAAALAIDVPRLEALVRPAVAAYARGDIDSQTYLTLSQNALARRADLDDRRLAAQLAEIRLETALFLPPANARTSVR